MRCFVLMGVAGCGKSSVGAALQDRAQFVYVDGDDLHPPANIEKMSAGIPLDDDDRVPWLRDVGAALARAEGRNAVGCSALKRKYRDIIRAAAGEPVGFIHLHAPKHVIVDRMAARTGHFMPTSLLDSQFADLEPLDADEDGWTIDITGSLDEVVGSIESHLAGLGDAVITAKPEH